MNQSLRRLVPVLTLIAGLLGCAAEMAAVDPTSSAVVVAQIADDGSLAYRLVPTKLGVDSWHEPLDSVRALSSVGELEAAVAALPSGATVLVGAPEMFEAYSGVVPVPEEVSRTLGGLRDDISFVDPRFDLLSDVEGIAGSQSGLSQTQGSGWGEGLRSQGNCYRYAANDPTKSILQGGTWDEHQESPGDLGPNRQGFFSCVDLVAAAKGDGMAATIPGTDRCPAEHYRVALVVTTAPVPNADFHWYRDNGDGTWSHKAGNTAVTNLDAPRNRTTPGNVIRDPRRANRDYRPVGGLDYDTFCAFLCVPNGGVDVDRRDRQGGGAEDE